MRGDPSKISFLPYSFTSTPYLLYYCIDVIPNILICKSDYLPSNGFKIFGSSGIIFLLIFLKMSITVYFNTQA